MRVQRSILAVILLACSVTACAVDVTGTAHPPPPLAFVRYVNAVSDTFNFDFRAVDQVDYSQPFLDTPFRALGDGNYQGYQAGSRHIRVFLDPNPANTTVNVDPVVVSTVMVDTTFTFTAGTYYTILHVGSARAGAAVKEKFWIITDALPAQATDFKFRVINAAPVLGAVDVYVNQDTTAAPPSGAPVAAGLAFQAAPTPYISHAVIPTVAAVDTSFTVNPPDTTFTIPDSTKGVVDTTITVDTTVNVDTTFAYAVFRMTTPGTTTAAPGSSANGYRVQLGTSGTSAADPIYGSSVAGSVFTAFIFDASAAGTKNSKSFATPGIVFWPDIQPPRTTNDMLRPRPTTHVANP